VLQLEEKTESHIELYVPVPRKQQGRGAATLIIKTMLSATCQSRRPSSLPEVGVGGGKAHCSRSVGCDPEHGEKTIDRFEKEWAPLLKTDRPILAPSKTLAKGTAVRCFTIGRRREISLIKGRAKGTAWIARRKTYEGNASAVYRSRRSHPGLYSGGKWRGGFLGKKSWEKSNP